MPADPIIRELKKSGRKIRDGFVLAGIGLLIALPRIYHQSYYFFPDYLKTPFTPKLLRLFFLYHILLTFGVLFVMILIGAYSCQRAKFEPFVFKGIKKFLLAVLLGACLIPFGYILSDHLLLFFLPNYYPRSIWINLAYPLSSSFPDELFARYGFLSLWLWICAKVPGRKNLANFLTSVFLTALAWQELGRYLPEPLKASEWGFLLGGVFFKHLLLGEVYFRYGFWQSFGVRLGMELRFPLYFWLFR